MSPAVVAQISSFRLRNKRQRAFTYPAKPRQHGLFLGQQALVQRHRRFPPDHPRLHQPQRQVQSLREGNRDRRLLCQLVDTRDDAALHNHKVRDQFRRRPLILARALAPLFAGNRIGCPKKGSLRPRKFFANRLEIRHSSPLLFIPQCSAGLLSQLLGFCCFHSPKPSRRQPLQTHAPTATPAPRQTPARKSAIPPAASRRSSRKAPKFPASPPVTP